RGQVAGGGAGDGVEPERARAGGGDGNRTILERERGIDGVVLDVDLVQTECTPEVVGLHQRGAAGVRLDDRLVLNGQQRAVAPDGLGAGGDGLAAHQGADGVVVVGDLERTEA